MPKYILLLGAGKSATALIDYLLSHAAAENWMVRIADLNTYEVVKKIGGSPFGQCVQLDVTNEIERKQEIARSSLVISLLPPALHLIVAKDCLQYGIHLLTASYVDPEIKKMSAAVERNGLLFLCEMGLDPGIDHMSAVKLIDQIHADGGVITSFVSHCGGLVSKESDTNSWHYKVSWNPRNVVTAGRTGADYLINGVQQHLTYRELFQTVRLTEVPGYGSLAWYPNRDSLSYRSMYQLNTCNTFIRTTLRHSDFIEGWARLIELGLTEDKVVDLPENCSLAEAFKICVGQEKFAEWLSINLNKNFDSQSQLLSALDEVVEHEREADDLGLQKHDYVSVVSGDGSILNLDANKLKISAAATLGSAMHRIQVLVNQLIELGFHDQTTQLPAGINTVSGILQFALENKLRLRDTDRDLVVMQHEIHFTNGHQKYFTTSTLLREGHSAMMTAMAETVGWPLGIAAKLLLRGEWRCRGVMVPVTAEIYEPVLDELEALGVRFTDETRGVK